MMKLEVVLFFGFSKQSDLPLLKLAFNIFRLKIVN